MPRHSLLVTAVLLGALAAPAAAQKGAVPPSGKRPPRDSVSVAAGAKLYAQYCQICHGKTGRGDGAGAASLKPKPRNFREPKQLKSTTDEDLFKVISKGGPALGLSPTMVGWGSILKEPQIRQLVAFVRSMIDSSAAAGAGAKGK
jgi:mono/diheme cytochrome c family protein